MTSLPLPAKTGSTCSKNHPTATITTTTAARITRPSGLVSRKAINVVLQHDDSSRAVHMVAVVLRPDPRLCERALGFKCGQAFIPLDDRDLAERGDETLVELVSAMRARRLVARQRDGPADDNGGRALFVNERAELLHQLLIVRERGSRKRHGV